MDKTPAGKPSIPSLTLKKTVKNSITVNLQVSAPLSFALILSKGDMRSSGPGGGPIEPLFVGMKPTQEIIL